MLSTVVKTYCFPSVLYKFAFTYLLTYLLTANLSMSPPLVMMKALFLQKIIDLAGILLPFESTVRSMHC